MLLRISHASHRICVALVVVYYVGIAFSQCQKIGGVRFFLFIDGIRPEVGIDAENIVVALIPLPGGEGSKGTAVRGLVAVLTCPHRIFGNKRRKGRIGLYFIVGPR